jgi:hypothetical protein
LLNRAIIVVLLALFAGCAHETPEPSGFHIEAIEPLDGAVYVETSATVTVRFSKPVHPDSINNANAILVVDSRSAILSGTFTVAENVVTFSPSGGFAADETFGVAVREFVFDTGGASLRYPRAVTFSTGDTVETIPGFPPFDSYPYPPDMTRIEAWLIGSDVLVTGAEGAVENGLNVNLRNQTLGSAWVSVGADALGAFSASLTGGADGDAIEVSVSDLQTQKTGPAGTLNVKIPPAWSLLPASGTGPSARYGHSAIYDPAHGRMIVFGGSTNAVGITASDGLYALDLTGAPTWSELAATGPSARFGHTAVYDSVGGRMIVFGGNTGSFGVLADIWVLTLTPGAETWIPLTPMGSPPSARAFSQSVFDPLKNRIILFGGEDGGILLPNRFSDLWALNLTPTPAWEQLYAEDPLDALGGLLSFPPRSGAATVYHPAGSRMLMAFGFGSIQSFPAPMSDAYALDLLGVDPVWSNLTLPQGAGRGYAPAVIDVTRNRVLIFGGRSSSTSFDDLQALDLASETWSEVEVPVGVPPPPMSGHSAIWDQTHARMILFGGADVAGGAVFDALYQLTSPP